MEEIRKIYESSPFNNYLGIKLLEFEEGKVIYSIKITPSHLNVNNAVHGGVYFSILDAVMGATIRSAIKKKVVTINANINFFAALTNGDTMFAAGKIVRLGKSIITAEGEITDQDGLLLAKTVGTFKVLRS